MSEIAKKTKRNFIAGTLFWSLIHSPKKISTLPSSPRVLIMPQLNRIGDLVCASSLWRELKRAWPGSQIDVLVADNVADLIRNDPHIHRVVLYKTIGFSETFREIVAGGYDVSINASGSALGSALAYRAGIPRRIKLHRAGRPWVESLTDWMNTSLVTYQDHSHLPSFYLRLLEPLGIHSTDWQPIVYPDNRRISEVDDVWRKEGIPSGVPIIGLSISAGNTIKEWGDEKFAQLIAGLSAQFRDASFVVLGGPRDRERVLRFLETFRLNNISAFSVIGLPLSLLPLAMKRFSAYVAVDTGPIYIAVSLGVPVVDITGPCDVREQPPSGEKALCVTPPFDAPSSFVFKSPGTNQEHVRALAETTVERVLEQAVPFLSRFL